MKDFLIVGENLASGQWCHQTKPNVVFTSSQAAQRGKNAEEKLY